MSTSWAWQMSLLSFRLKSAVAKAEKEAYWEFSFYAPTTSIQQSLENWVLNPMTSCMLSSLSFGERLWVGLVQSFSQTRRLSFELGQQTHGFSWAFIAYKLVGMHPSTKPNLYLTLLCHKHFHLKNLLFLDEEYLPTGLHDKRWNYVSQTKAATRLNYVPGKKVSLDSIKEIGFFFWWKMQFRIEEIFTKVCFEEKRIGHHQRIVFVHLLCLWAADQVNIIYDLIRANEGLHCRFSNAHR